MVAPALIVGSFALLCCVLLVFRSAFRPAFPSPDELAQWVTRLRVTGVQFTAWGSIRHVVIDQLPVEPERETETIGDTRGEDTGDDLVDAVFDRFRRKAKRSA